MIDTCMLIFGIPKERTRLTNIHKNMIARCENPNFPLYHRYVGRGIKVCDEWLNNFETFYNWAMDNGYENHLTIDREDNDGDYTPDNCRWATMAEQNINRSIVTGGQQAAITATYNGETRLLKDWADIVGISKNTLYRRYRKYGDDAEKLFTRHRLKNRD